MTPDARITHDLAILGRVNRERPLAFDATLRHVGAAPAVARSTTATREHSSAKESVALIPFARIFALRVGRIWAGAAALTSTLAILVLVVMPRPTEAPPPHGVFYEIFYSNTVWVFAAALVPTLAAYGLATAIAMRRFERAIASTEEPLRRAREMLTRFARASVAIPMLGILVPCLFFGLTYVTIGHWNMMSMFQPIDDPVIEEAADWAFGLWAAASAISCIAAFAASRLRAAAGWWIPLGIVVVFTTMTIGMQYDIGPAHNSMVFNYHPSFALRAILTATGTLGLIFIVGGTLVRRWAREDRDLAAHQ